MPDFIQLVRQFHEKFQIPVLDNPALIPEQRSSLRLRLIREEVEEYHQGVLKEDLPNIAQELADILYSVYGTILEHGLQDIIPEVFAEVHRSNMSKEYHPLKIKKGPDFQPVDLRHLFLDKKEGEE